MDHPSRASPARLLALVERLALAAGLPALAVGLAILALALRPGAPPLLAPPGPAELAQRALDLSDPGLVSLARTALDVGLFVLLTERLRALAQAAGAALAAPPDPDAEDDAPLRAQAERARAAHRALISTLVAVGWIAILWSPLGDLVQNALRIGLRIAGHGGALALHLDPHLPLIAVGGAPLVCARVLERAAVEIDDARHTV